jgi:hypothetical protein
VSIPEAPTYFVGQRGVWVHNCPFGRVMSMREAQAITKGHGGSIEAHHLIEHRHFRNGTVGGNHLDSPGVVMTKEEHGRITYQLSQRMPYDSNYEVSVLRAVYREVYADYPEWAAAVDRYLSKQ